MIKRVLIFGTFDGYDEGHQFVVSQAAKLANELVVAVARDEHVRFLKKKEPKYSEQVRLLHVSQDPLVKQAVLSDVELGSYNVIDQLKPNIVAFGFDQHELKQDFCRWQKEKQRDIRIETLEYLPE